MFAQAIQLDGKDPKRARLGLSFLIPLSKASPAADSNTSEVHFCSTGEWRGHANGPFRITANDIDSMVNAFDAQVNPVAMDYDHKSLNQFAPPENGKASGWIQSLKRVDAEDGPQLWGSVEWTPAAADMIRAGEFKFISPVIDPYPTDRVTGEPIGGCEMLGAALTNNPFFDGQAPVSLTRFALTDAASAVKPDAKDAPDPKLQKLATALGEYLKPDAAKSDAKPSSSGNDSAPAPKPAAAASTTEPKPAAPPAPPPVESAPTVNNKENDEYAVGMTAFADQMMAACGLDRGTMINAFSVYASDIASVINRNLQRDKPANRGAFAAFSRSSEISMPNTEDQNTQTPPANAPATDATPPAAASSPPARTNESEDARVLRIELAAKDREIELLRQRDEERGARERKANEDRVAADVDQRIAAGRLSQDQREDAIWLFSNNPDRAEKIFGKAEALVRAPIAGTDPAVANGGAATVSAENATDKDLTESERDLVFSMTRGGVFTREQCVKHVVAKRADIAEKRKQLGLPA